MNIKITSRIIPSTIVPSDAYPYNIRQAKVTGK